VWKSLRFVVCRDDKLRQQKPAVELQKEPLALVRDLPNKAVWRCLKSLCVTRQWIRQWINKPNVMSETESDYDDEDLSAPPKRPNDSKSISSITNSSSVNVLRDGEDTVDEEGDDGSLSERRSSVKRKRDNLSPRIPESTSSRRVTREGRPFN